MKKIEKLTPEQEALLPLYRDRWLAIGLSTEPLNFERAKSAAVLAYKCVGLKPPKYFYRFQSPLSAAVGAAVLKSKNQVGDQVGAQVRDQVWAQVWDQVWDQVGDQVWAQARGQVWAQVRAQARGQVGAQVRAQARGQVGDQVRDKVGDQVWDQVWAQVRDQVWAQVGDQVGDQVWAQVWDQVWAQVGDQVGDQVGAQVRDQVWAQVGDQVGDQVWDQVWAQVGDQVGDQVWAQVRDQVWAQVRDQVWAQVGDQVRDKVGDQVWDQVRDQAYGCHDADWLGFYAFFKEIGIETNRLNGLIGIAENCGWWAPYQNAVILQDRPTKILFDDQKRLHCADGPAIEYRDDFCVYSWHGTRIPGKWIDNPLPAAEALRWENMEQRRAACEIVGWHRILDELQAVSIDKSENPFVGELLSVNIPDIGREKFLRVMCGTARDFALPVPPEMERASQAQAWLNFTTEDMYLPKVRT